MKQIIQNYRTGKSSVEEVPTPVVQSGMILVQNAYSLISVGTERTSIELAKKSLLQKAKSRPQDFKRVLNLAKKQGLITAYKTAMERLEMPTPLGYSSAGVVLEVGEGVNSIKVGEKVACAGAGYANHAEVICVPENLCAKVPAGVPLDWASFTTLGSIALQGIRQADVRVGETVAVIGLGLLGQLTVQILKAAGCRVIGLDIDDEKIELAKKVGAVFAFNARSKNLVSNIYYQTSGNGADAVIITAATESNEPFLLAPQIARDRAKIVLVGVAKLDFPREPYYRKELSVILSRSYGPGRYDPQYEEKGIDYPIGYVRWTEKRNMEAVLNLMAEKKLDIAPLITHKFKIEDAQRAYDLILGKTKEKYLGVLFEYDTKKEHTAKILIGQEKYPDSDIVHRASSVSVGFIGAGNFARSFLLPNLRFEGINLIALADIQGPIAKMTAQKYGFKYCTTNYKELLNDKAITTIFIATRHNLHAQLIIESLKSGKNTFCEKPLCLNQEELNEIIKVHNSIASFSPLKGKGMGEGDLPILLIGFNRRFAPLTLHAKEFLHEKVGPFLINYRVNAGPLPQNHWVYEQGGRIIGEVCHFVDLINYFIGAPLESVYAESLSGENVKRDENILVTLKYTDGSVGSISYFAVGDSSFPKERVEIFGNGKICIIDDFCEMIFSDGGKSKRIKQKQDKGHKNEVIAFLDAIKNGKPSPISFAEIVEATLATFAINESLISGKTEFIPEINLKTGA